MSDKTVVDFPRPQVSFPKEAALFLLREAVHELDLAFMAYHQAEYQSAEARAQWLASRNGPEIEREAAAHVMDACHAEERRRKDAVDAAMAKCREAYEARNG